MAAAKPAASTPVRVLVVVPERTFKREDGSDGSFDGYWAAGRLWPTGSTKAVLEDEPLPDLQVHDFTTGEIRVVKRVLTVEQKINQLKHAMGGQVLVGRYELKDGKEVPVKSPALLHFEILDEQASASAK